MDQRIIELALEALEIRKAQIDREIAELRDTSMRQEASFVGLLLPRLNLP
jgi:hypothetical protein